MVMSRNKGVLAKTRDTLAWYVFLMISGYMR